MPNLLFCAVILMKYFSRFWNSAGKRCEKIVKATDHGGAETMSMRVLPPRSTGFLLGLALLHDENVALGMFHDLARYAAKN